jgi:hypothetical protein
MSSPENRVAPLAACDGVSGEAQEPNAATRGPPDPDVVTPDR